MFRRSSQIGLVLTFLVWPCFAVVHELDKVSIDAQGRISEPTAGQRQDRASDGLGGLVLFAGVCALGLGALDHVGKPKPSEAS